MTGRSLPKAIEIERQVLGAMLLDPAGVDAASEILSADDFAEERNATIYASIMRLSAKSVAPDVVTVANELGADADPTYLAALTMGVTSAANVVHHARIVLEKSLLRNLIEKSAAVINRAFDPAEDAFEVIDAYQQVAFDLDEKRFKGQSFTDAQTATFKTIDWLESIHGKELTGVPSGYPDIDILTGGWQDSDLIIVGGRPGQGKTAFALSLARNAALHPRKRVNVGIFSLEMSTQQLLLRLLCMEARVNSQLVRQGKLPPEQWSRLNNAAVRISASGIYINDQASITIAELRAKARRLRRDKNIGLLIVDYLQLVTCPGAENRTQEVGAISRQLKALAKDLSIPIIALAQLSRGVESRKVQRPVLSDLRESGAIEQDADVVTFVHRPETYLDPTTDEYRHWRGQAEIIVAKQRNGPIDTVKLAYISQHTLFESLRRVDDDPPPVRRDNYIQESVF